MRLLTKLLVFLFFMGLVYAAWYVYGDSRLSSEAKSTLRAAAPAKASDGFIYLLGIGAPIDDDPIVEDERLLSEIRKYEKKYTEITDFSSFIDFKYESSLEALKGNGLFCLINNRGCLNSIFTKNIKTNINEDELKVIDERFDILLTKANFKSQLQPHYFEPLVNTRFLIIGSRLKALQIIKEARACCPQEAAIKLYGLIELYKHYVENSNTLIDKIIGYRAVSDSIEILYRLQKDYQLLLPSIPMLSASQLSLDEAVNREFAIIKSFADNFSHLDPFKDSPNFSGNPKWFNRSLKKVGYKKNLSLNKILTLYNGIKNISTSPISDYAEKISEYGELKESLESHSFHNAGGFAILSKYMPSLGQFFSGFNVNAKISLFNQLIKKPEIDLESLMVNNPFFPGDSNAVVFDEEDYTICLKNPVEDSSKFSCLHL